MPEIKETFPGTVPEADLAAERMDRRNKGAASCHFGRQGDQWVMLTDWGIALAPRLTEFFPSTASQSNLLAEKNDRLAKGAHTCDFERRGAGWVMYTDWGDVFG